MIRAQARPAYTHTRAFTLVETLIAITILMIAIAGPLVIATKGLTSANYSKNQMIASYLAQESMEVIKNVRDNNVYQYRNNQIGLETNWLNTIDGGSGTPCVSSANMCDASGINSSSILDCPNPPGCAVYYSEATGYNTQNSSDTQTQFYRHYYLETVDPTEVRVHVFVDWNEGTIPFQIHLVSTMSATSR